MCDVCGKVYATNSGLSKHRAIKHNDTEAATTLQCNVCNTKFTTKGHLQGHVNAHHGIKLFQCDICKSRYAYRSSFLRHTVTCNGKKPPRTQQEYKCDTCQQVFMRKDTLQDHIQGKHEQTMKYRCQDCNASFNWRSSLVNHMRSKRHAKERM